MTHLTIKDVCIHENYTIYIYQKQLQFQKNNQIKKQFLNFLDFTIYIYKTKEQLDLHKS